MEIKGIIVAGDSKGTVMKNNTIKNIISLYGLSIAKIVFPLITLPYLTRILTVDTYGSVSYVKTIMSYFQTIIDFGFLLSGTKDIIMAKDNKNALAKELGDILLAKIIIALLAFVCLLVLANIMPIMQGYEVYGVLSFVPLVLSMFLHDHLFRGMEIMHIITIRFFLTKGISTILTLVFVKGDADVYWIPTLDIVSSLIAVGLVAVKIKQLQIMVKISSVRNAIKKLKESAVYFASNMTTTIFAAFNTLIIGTYLQASDVAYWTICIQIIGTIQALYAPIIDGVYPSMIRTKERRQIQRILLIIMPVIVVGTGITFFASEIALLIVGGQKYIGAVPILRILTSVLLFGFPVMLLGWPTLGAIGRQQSVTNTTFFAACFQASGLLLLALFGKFTLVNIALVRGATEIAFFLSRLWCCGKYRHQFN